MTTKDFMSRSLVSGVTVKVLGTWLTFAAARFLVTYR